MATAKKFIKAIENLITEPVVPVGTKKLKIMFVAAEAAPFATVGGFSSVVKYLSKELIKKGHDVRVFIPKFGFIDEEKFDLKLVYEGLKVPTDDPNNPFLICNIKYTEVSGVPTYFLENREYYELRANVYGYSDDPTRWALLSRGALEFISKTNLFEPEIIHSHDWHTGLVSNYISKNYSKDPIVSRITSVFTIHNLSYQGVFDHNHISELDFDDGKSAVASFFDNRINTQNFMRRGILYADVVNTVSKTYSREILEKENGQGLDKLLNELRSKLYGIVNGIDYEEYNPSTDSLLEQNYDINSLELRKDNKKSIQREFNLHINDDVLLMGFVGRLDWQKGVDLIVSTLEHVLKDFNVQFVHVGGGDGHLANLLKELARAHPEKVGVHTYPNFTLPRLFFGGCDVILYPSRFEPCGIVQLEAMRYGSLPIVRKVGGLADTVEDFDPSTGKGTGFVFKDFDEFSLYGQIVRATELYRQKDLWKKAQKNAMSQDFSWSYSAKEYIRLYERAMSINGINETNPKSRVFE